MKTILDLVDRVPVPAPWAEGDNIPWDDPEFSERMLAEHLSQDHDLASRRSETIDRHVEWIVSTVLDSRRARVLDLACGPGLYTGRLAGAGYECVGIDFSPASIRHARDVAATEAHWPCSYIQADLRQGNFGEGFDLAMMVYGQFNVFPRRRAGEILTSAHAALKPGGTLLLEVQGFEQIRRHAEAAPSWYSAASGLFSAAPHLVLQENHWHAEAKASTTRFHVIDGRSGTVRTFALSNEAYTKEELAAILRGVGFDHVQWFPSLCGTVVDEEQDLPVLVARR